MDKRLDEALEILGKGEYSCVVIRKDGSAITSSEPGVKRLMNIFLSERESLLGSAVADKVIGRAAAAILAEGRAKSCYALLISDGAIEILRGSNIEYFYEAKVSAIQNRDRTDFCPMEKLTLGLDAEEAVKALEKFLSKK